MTVDQIKREWMRLARVNDRAEHRIPISQGYGETPVVFPDGTPVRRVEIGFVGGQSVVILSGER